MCPSWGLATKWTCAAAEVVPALNVSNALNKGWAGHLVGRAVLEAGARVLGQHSISVMPLKGIWLQQFVYADPSERPITDVDVLVPDALYARALTALRDAGWAVCGSNAAETALSSPAWPLALDVHRALFVRGGFDMPTSALFERGTIDERSFGVRVVSPDPLDVFAHLVGHFVKSRGGRDSDSHQLRDFPALASRFELEPAATARHLERCGLARASRYALQCVPEVVDASGFCRATLAELGADPVGQLCARSMLALREYASAGSPFAVLPAFALERSLRRGVICAALRAFDRVRAVRDA
jgi:hypothetical protein